LVDQKKKKKKGVKGDGKVLVEKKIALLKKGTKFLHVTKRSTKKSYTTLGKVS